MTALKILFRRAKTLLWTAFSILVILAAVGVGVGKLLMPYSDRYQPRLEAWLSQEFGRPVVLDSFEGDWTAFGPRLSLRGLRLLPPTEDQSEISEMEVAIESAALDIRPLNVLIPGLPLYNFRVIGADFELRHTADGRFELSGFGVSHRDGKSSALKELARVGEVVLQDSSLVYQDEKYGILLGFSGIQGRLWMEGDALDAEIQANFEDTRSGMVYGEIEARVMLELDEDQKLRDLAWQAEARDLMLAAFQGRLPSNPFLPITGWLNAELWGDWSPDAGYGVRGISDLREARLVNEHQDLRLEQVNYRFRWTFRDKGDWELHFADLLYDDGQQSWLAPRISMARDIGDGLGLWISADELPLDVPLNLARGVMSVYGTAWPKYLPGAAAGQIEGLDLMLNERWRLELARGEFRDASVFQWDRWPDLRGLNGRVALHHGFGRLSIRGDNVVAEWPRMFREPLAFGLPSCELDLRWGEGWQVGFRNCSLSNADLDISADAVLASNEGKPAVNVNVAVTRGDVSRLSPYWPEAIIKDNVKTWLRRALVSGEIVSGRFQIHGDMDDWPFRDGRGRFEALAEVSGADLDYFDGWPRADGLNAQVHFQGAAMEIQGTVENMGGIEVESVSAGIGDMKSPLLRVEFSARDDLPAFLGFLQQTPLRDQIRVDLDQFQFAGKASTDGLLTVPLGRNADGAALAVDGIMDLRDGLFSDPGSEVTLEGISGRLHYDEKGFTASGLDAVFRQHPARLDLAAGVDLQEKFRADLTGIFDVADVIPAFLLESYSELERIEGICPWDVSLTVIPGEDADVTETVLTVESGLLGVGLNLPAPMNKPKGARWPLRLRLPLTGERRLLDIVFRDRATLRFDLPPEAEAPSRSVIRLGPGLPDLPPQGFIRIEGKSADFDLDGWIDIVVEGALEGRGMGGLELEQSNFSAGNLLFLDREFPDVGLSIDALESDIRAGFSGNDIEGKVRFTTGQSGMNSLSAEFERLALGEPVSGGMDMETDPADLPALHLYARSLRYAGVELGETRIEAYPTATGFHFEKVDAASDQLTVLASGNWYLTAEGQRSEFEINMASESLGEFLESMDISSSMQGGQTLVKFSAWWPGSPATFALSRLNGEIEFSVVDGNITSASAGTGRLLGLLSVQALPRRLALDFRDVFDSGFSFSEAGGSFQLENGLARTEDVQLKSSAASISISGSTNLVEQRYDQLLTIRPGLGNTLPIIGALAAGPGGAAAGLALQGLLQESLGEATQVQYTITGDWADPQFEAVDVTRVDQAQDTKNEE
jgi:uncharacterized protein (TIGR02099 family)